MHKHMPERSC